MKRINVILGKKQIVVASLTVLLGAAVAANFMLTDDKPDITDNATEVANYGEAAYVSDTSAQEASSAYFAQARLDKQNSRDEAVEVLRSMYQGGDLTVDELSMVEEDAATLTQLIETETKIETLLKAQGFEDVLCYLDEDSANIIVKTAGLDAAGAAKIKSTLLGEREVMNDKITIVEVN